MDVDGTDFSEWLSDLAREAGYDPEPRRGGRTRLAQAAGLNATHVGRLLDGVTKPDIDTMKKLVEALNAQGVRVTVIDMLLHTGDLETEDLGDLANKETAPTPEDVDLWTLGGNLGVPEGQRHLFGALVHSVAEQLTHGQKPATVSNHATQTGGKSSAEG